MDHEQGDRAGLSIGQAVSSRRPRGKAEGLGHSFVGPTHCTKYGGPFCIYPWYSWDGHAFNYGVSYPNTAERLGQANQFQKRPTCPAGGVFPGHTYCDAIVR